MIPTGTLNESEELIQEVPIAELAPSPYQPRRKVDEESLAELAESIKAHGILQPLILRRSGKGYQIIAGERRLRAAIMAGLTRVPVVIREAGDQEMLELALVENLQREDINAMEAAEAYHRLIDEFGLNQEQVSARVGKSRSAVANTLRLLSLPMCVQNSLREGAIEEGHGKILASIGDHRLLMSLWRRIVRRGLSVKATADIAAKVLGRGDVPRGTILGRPNISSLDPNLANVQDRMREHLGADTRIRPKPRGSGGVVEIHYSDWEDLDRIYQRIMLS